ncbi:MAG: hypothetical protein QF492_08280 [Candidatus Krumholzibacteria bacterium]|jgi:DnaJ-class molecular chaperone|nr:hypothetical protein [Candidatus Krumholzibacteria bacterium]MDP6669885.1 hypothetical protein [Candidatus Krumholzibacteria bacterium]MDP6796807.1 hypothetical protein [Candidatus Krumholzibacteria bacterium]MDP7021057.1 hypothetical protein [Candidatus Krumholzibacteria bacterium]
MSEETRLVNCEECGGTGMVEDDECSFCMGNGKVEVDEEETWDVSETGEVATDVDEGDLEEMDEILEPLEEEDF